MKLICEVSRDHYHPGPDFDMPVTKKRDLSVPPNWVANEKIQKDGKWYSIVMPPRDKELYEVEQEVHIHVPEYIMIEVNGKQIRAKVKVSAGVDFEPRAHFGELAAEHLGIKQGDEGSA
jgi:hypothetical protein